MAGLQHRNGSYRILFRYLGKQHTLTLGAVTEEEAETKASQVDYLLMRLKQKLAVLPPGIDIVEFVQMDGRVLPPASPEIQKISLAALRDQYVATHRTSLEPNTLKCIQIHFRRKPQDATVANSPLLPSRKNWYRFQRRGDGGRK